MKRILKTIGLILGVILLLAIIAAVFFASRTSSRMEQRFDVQPVLTSVVADSATLARGEHLLKVEGCWHCHAENLEGQVMMDMPLWRMTAQNLTSGQGGIGRDYTVADWDRAIRSGVARDGRSLLIMPTEVYKNLSDADASALIAYLQQVAPRDAEHPPRELRFLGKLMLGMGNYDPANAVHEPGSAPKVTPAHEPTLELGEYMTSISCQGCHGADFQGKDADDPNCPPSPALDASADWSLDQFTVSLRTGTTPDGRAMIDQCMPWSAFGQMTDTEIEAVYKYVRSEVGAAG